MVLKPKSKEEVLNEFLYMTNDEFEKSSVKFMTEFGQEIPPEYKPLSVQIIDEAKKRGYWHHSLIRIKRTVLHNVYVFGGVKRKKIELSMFPFRKIKGLEHLRNGNSYLIDSMDTYIKIQNFLETV